MGKTKLHIVGTHGVPAKYGGFETLADHLCQHLGDKYDVTVYCNGKKYKSKIATYHGANLIYLPIDASGASGIIYDLITFLYACFKADIILYLSPVGSGFITPLRYIFGNKVVMNHGGLNEWEREKLTSFQKKWVKFNHNVAAHYSNINIVDNFHYKQSLKDNFGVESTVIRYGGDHVKKISTSRKDFQLKYPFTDKKYAVSISRAQVDNNLHLVLKSFETFLSYPLVLISNWNISDYGKELYEKYKFSNNIILLDAIYDKEELDYVRGNAYVYIHSHSRCGTAPSLVEAMLLTLPIISYDVPTNRETTKGKAVYFSSLNQLVQKLSSLTEKELKENRISMYDVASSEYTWEAISSQYNMLFKAIM